MPKCPDCRGGVELVEVRQMAMGPDDNLDVFVEEHYWKCPSCRTEFDPEDVEE